MTGHQPWHQRWGCPLRASPSPRHKASLLPLRLQAMLHEFKLDYNQKHFVRNETFKKAADSIQVTHAVPPILGPLFCKPWKPA